MLARILAGPSPQTGYAIANTIVLVWDIYLAGRIVNNRRGSPLFLALTALAALLTVPAVVVAATATTNLNGRAIYIIEWLWPLVLGIFALQAGDALVRGWISPFLGVPIALFNLMLFAAGSARFATTLISDPPATVAALSAAHASVLAFVFGRVALSSPFMLQIPVLAPSYPAPYGLGKTMRVALGSWAAFTIALFIAEYPRAVRAAATFATFSAAPFQGRTRGDFLLGVRILPAINGPPRPLAIRQDLALIDSLDPGAIAVVVRPGPGAATLALDSLAHVLAAGRADTTLLVVILAYGADDRASFQQHPEDYLRERLRTLDRVVRRLQPDVVFPALDPYVAGIQSLGDVPASWWHAYLRGAATIVHAAVPGARVGVSVSAYTAPDSDLFSWATANPEAIDVFGVSLYPSYGGGSSLVARCDVAERWLRNGQKPVWVVATGAYPRLYGEANQERSLRGTLAWATAQRRVEAFIVDGAGDYDALTGLRAPGGRLRPAVDMLVRAKGILAGVGPLTARD